jgi:hypothetical protein
MHKKNNIVVKNCYILLLKGIFEKHIQKYAGNRL